jgi:hypothetical protein
MRTLFTLLVLEASNGKESAMEIRLESARGSRVGSLSETISQFAAQTEVRQGEWAQRLAQTPDAFAEVERDIDQYFRQGAGQVTAALLAAVTAQAAMQVQAEQVRRQATHALQKSKPRPLQIRLLCGLMLFITTGYCAPRRKPGETRTERPSGLYPELAALGLGKGCSPALQYTVARIVALSPSIALAHKELSREGIRLDKKTVRRIAEQFGGQLLALRRREVFAWRAGILPSGSDFAGRRVAVQIDGGRVRLRENKGKNRKRKKNQRGKFATPWREPKVLTLFEIDEKGKMTRKERQPLIDGTLLGPDHLMELVAYHLCRLGVDRAELVVFASDGARWIWERLDWVVRRAGLDPSRVVYVLDFCHAAHHISLALQALGMNEGLRKETFARLRKFLKRSRYDEVVAELERLAAGQPPDSVVWREIRYLRKHGEAGHLQYETFRRRGIPCGSGAIESVIRRVINLRLKSNAMYWLPANAEGMFAIRALLLCDRWEEMLPRVRQTMARDRRMDWTWEAPDTSNHLKDEPDPSPAQPQPLHRQQPTTVAA